MSSSALIRRLPFARSTTPLQAATYLLGISLFSISFLVFLNSSVSFVITDLIGVKEGVGDIVGTLGFVDELVALVACPAWGLASDRLGVRNVAVVGYAVIGLSLVLFVQATNVYPQLLLARILFAVGATAAATMVTAILPPLTDESDPGGSDGGLDGASAAKPTHNPRNSVALSLESQLTITPERFAAQARSGSADSDPDSDPGFPAADEEEARLRSASSAAAAKGEAAKPSVLAGLVGLFTGCGALVALFLFLPLPVRFGRGEGTTSAQAVAYSFYVVGVVALFVAAFVFVGLRGIKGEEGKGWRLLLGLGEPEQSSTSSSSDASDQAVLHRSSRPSSKDRYLPYGSLLRSSIALGFRDPQIGLGYLGGFVARASTVAISLFIPLFINTFYISNGFCRGSPNDPSPELKKECRAAYVLASILTGVAQLVGLVCAPFFGHLASRTRTVNYPVVAAASFGIVGYVAFPHLRSPEIRDVDGRGGGPLVFLVAALLGISQIGAIVCSLGLLGRGVLTVDLPEEDADGGQEEEDEQQQTRFVNGDGQREGGLRHPPEGDYAEPPATEVDETSPLLNGSTATASSVTTAAAAASRPRTISRVRLKGSIAGVYSWCGGAAILLLTKLGGYLFDTWSRGAPFYMMALFNAVLLLATVAVDASRFYRARKLP